MCPHFLLIRLKSKLPYAVVVGVFFVALFGGALFSIAGWLPSTDHLSGHKTGWFGKPLGKSLDSAWSPWATPLPAPTPQLTKEYIYSGSRLLAVADAGAQEAAPSDLAVWRPSTGTWWVMGSGQGSQQVAVNWGLPSDKPVPGDYDGDGKTDFSIFRPGGTANDPGQWFVLRSSDETWDPVIQWGLNADSRSVADFDGDGKTDRAVWRSSDGIWYIRKSSDGSALHLPFGSPGDVPSPADYDGDGLADRTVWRPSERTFHVSKSSDGSAQVVQLNFASTEPVSCDYDGDGKADFAVRSGDYWWIRNSSDGSLEGVLWKSSGDVAVPNDYDGDGKCDVAVWRGSDVPPGSLGYWYIRQSAHNHSERAVQWGIELDIPVPSYYRR